MSETPRAFPELRTLHDNSPGGSRYVAESAGGMSLRDYFAGRALHALVSNDSALSRIMACGVKDIDNGRDDGRNPGDYVAEAAYAYADAMLKARAGRRTGDE